MKNRLPSLPQQTKICIICEGDEEYEYLDKLRELNVWNEKYDIVLENADGNGNVPARYQDKYQNGSFDVVLLFCDTDRKPVYSVHAKPSARTNCTSLTENENHPHGDCTILT